MNNSSKLQFDPKNVDLTTADTADIICFLTLGENEYNGGLGIRIVALFVILFVSTAFTCLPVIATSSKRIKLPYYVYLFARYFGAGVIIATAFIHLLDPAYAEIGPQSCVGSTGGWSSYSWVAALVLTSVMLIFLLDFAAERYVKNKYGLAPCHADLSGIMAGNDPSRKASLAPSPFIPSNNFKGAQDTERQVGGIEDDSEAMEKAQGLAFRQQIAAFLVLEFGIIFHSVIIGMNLGTAGDEFSILFPVLVFHQSFEGLGIGARLSAIPIPQRLSWLPWLLCVMYGLTTPVAIAIGLCLKTTYNSGSFTANVVSGVFDAISAGILIYTGLVELLARDFIFNPERIDSNKRIAFMVCCVFLGVGIMALLGKWA